MIARTYLLASLTPTIRKTVNERLKDSDSFPVVWLQFLKAILSTSIERFADFKASFKKRLPSQYSGENVELLAPHQFRRDALELTTAGQHDHNRTLSTLKIFLLANGSSKGKYRHKLHLLQDSLEPALIKIGFKEKTAANSYMIEHRLTYRDICTKAERNKELNRFETLAQSVRRGEK